MGEAHALRVPLDAEDGQLFMVQSLHDEILGILGHEKAASCRLYGLVVGAVYDRAGAVELEEKGPPGSFGNVDPIPFCPGVDVLGIRF